MYKVCKSESVAMHVNTFRTILRPYLSKRDAHFWEENKKKFNLAVDL